MGERWPIDRDAGRDVRPDAGRDAPPRTQWTAGRRRWVLTAAAACVVLGGAAVAVPSADAVRSRVAARPSSPQHPAVTTAGSASAVVNRPAAGRPIPQPLQLQLDVLADNVIHRPDGTKVTLRLPAGHHSDDAIEIPGGWLIEATRDGDDDEETSVLFLAAANGFVRRIGPLSGDYQVSDDGRVLVVTGHRSKDSVEAWNLPSLRLIRRTTFDSAMGPIVAGVSGDRVLLSGAQGDPAPAEAAIWNLRTGALHRTGAEIDVVGMSSDTIVRRVGGVRGAGNGSAVACLDAVPLADRLSMARGGLCGARIAGWASTGDLSPDGRWVVVRLRGEQEQRDMLLRTADIRAGRWRPLPSPLAADDGSPLFWDSAETFIIFRDDGVAGYYRCGVAGACAPVAMPPGVTDAIPVRRAVPSTGSKGPTTD